MRITIPFLEVALWGVLAYALTGCGQGNYPPTPPSTLTPWPIAKPSLPAFTVTRPPIPDETETVTPLPALLPSKSSLSLTPLPTLSPEEREERVLRLLSNHDGCWLPCWWGMSPGKSTWLDIWKELSPLEPNPYIAEVSPDTQFVAFLIPVPREVSLAYGINVALDIVNGIVHTINISRIEGATHLSIQRVLVDYGKPSEVWVHAYRSYLGGVPPGEVLLFYPGQGILFRYANGMSDIDEKNDSAKICLDAQPDLALWSPDVQVSFDQAQDLARLDYKQFNKPLFPLEQVTDISVEQFYGQRTNEHFCIRTKLSLWPEP